MKLFFLLMAGLFGWSAYLQNNDPDPAIWMSMYCFVAVLALLSAFGKPMRLGILAGLAACAWLGWKSWGGALEFWNNEDGIGIKNTMSNEHPYIEEMREFGGVVITAVALLLMLVSSFGKGKKGKKHPG